jgi:hypothetical protein
MTMKELIKKLNPAPDWNWELFTLVLQSSKGHNVYVNLTDAYTDGECGLIKELWLKHNYKPVQFVGKDPSFPHLVSGEVRPELEEWVF